MTPKVQRSIEGFIQRTPTIEGVLEAPREESSIQEGGAVAKEK